MDRGLLLRIISIGMLLLSVVGMILHNTALFITAIVSNQLLLFYTVGIKPEKK